MPADASCHGHTAACLVFAGASNSILFVLVSPAQFPRHFTAIIFTLSPIFIHHSLCVVDSAGWYQGDWLCLCSPWRRSVLQPLLQRSASSPVTPRNTVPQIVNNTPPHPTPHFASPWRSLLYSQKPATFPYPEPHEFSLILRHSTYLTL